MLRLFFLTVCAIAVFGSPLPLVAESTAPPPPPKPIETERAEEPGMNQRDIFRKKQEALREIGGEGDYSGFEDQASDDAVRRRDEALERGRQQKMTGEIDPIEEEMFQEALNEAGVFGGTGCFARPPALSDEGDLAQHKTLERDDFREKRPDRTRTPGGIERRVHATLFVVVSCALRAEVEKEGEGHFVARAKKVAYFPLFSRSRSWWNPDSREKKATVLAHQQRHLELARLLADDLTARFEAGEVAIRAEARSEKGALAKFQLQWGKHIRQSRDELRQLERAYDRETDYGNDADRQRAWETRIGEGLEAVRAGMPPN